MDLEKLLGSSCRQKILKVLMKLRETNVTDLVRKVNSTYSEVNRNLQVLEKEGITKKAYYGRIQLIKLNHENSKTKALLKALKILKTENYTIAHAKRELARSSPRTTNSSLNYQTVFRDNDH